MAGHRRYRWTYRPAGERVPARYQARPARRPGGRWCR